MNKKNFFTKICPVFFLVIFTALPLHADIANGSKAFGKYTFFMSESGTGTFPRAHFYDDIIQEAAKTHKLDPCLIKAVIRMESGFNPKAVSKKGAMGLMQLMPGTARSMGVSDPFKPKENVFGGARYLRKMLNQFDGNVEHALAAYHAGPASVIRNNGVPPYTGTRDYINKVKYFRAQYQ